jgi:hypothetical protein
MVKELKIQEIVSKYRKIYEKLRPTYSPALNAKIIFNIFGFKHLIFKNKHRRDNETIYDRLVLIPLIVPVIKLCDEPVEIRKRKEDVKGKKTWVEYNALEAKVGQSDARVRVVTRKVGEKGAHYFQSIMKYN